MLLTRRVLVVASLLAGSCTLAEPAPESLSGGDSHCMPGTKSCGRDCVVLDSPIHGCSAVSCQPCALAHASAVCAAGECAVGTCESGWRDCDQDPANGCEDQADDCSCRSVVFMTPQAAVVVAEDGMNLGDGDWTWEAWVKASGSGRWEFSMNDEGHELEGLTVSIDAHVGCNIVPDGPLVFGRNNVVAFDAMRFGQWQHVACQRSGGSLTIYVDGLQKATGVIDVPVIARSAGRMGRMQTPPFHMGPVRFSRQARYAKDFTPLKRWTPDPDTILLYLVNRGLEEKTIIDEADGSNAGVIMGGVVASAGDTPCVDSGP